MQEINNRSSKRIVGAVAIVSLGSLMFAYTVRKHAAADIPYLPRPGIVAVSSTATLSATDIHVALPIVTQQPSAAAGTETTITATSVLAGETPSVAAVTAAPEQGVASAAEPQLLPPTASEATGANTPSAAPIGGSAAPPATSVVVRPTGVWLPTLTPEPLPPTAQPTAVWLPTLTPVLAPPTVAPTPAWLPTFTPLPLPATPLPPTAVPVWPTADMPLFRKLGNWSFVLMVRALFGGAYTDLCYGYNAFWVRTLPKLNLDGDGFEIETIMNVRALTENLKVAEVPSFEAERVHGVGRLRTFPDGWRVLKAIVREGLRNFGRGMVPTGEEIEREQAMTEIERA